MHARNSYLALTGVVVGSRSFGESGRFIDFLTDTHGRISVIARGARSSKKRFAGALDLFITLDIELRTKKEPWGLESVDIKKSRLGIRNNLEAFKRAQLVCEIVRVFTYENMLLDGFYQAVERAFDLLAENRCFETVEEYPKMLKSLGVFPDLRVCSDCGFRKPEALMDKGGLVKPVCLTCDNDDSGIAAFKVLKGASCRESKSATRLEHYILDCLEDYLGRSLKTRRICAVL